MKILYVIHDNKRGGAAISFLEMVSQIMKVHEVFVITPHKNGFLPEQLDLLGVKHINAHYYAWFIGKPESKLGLKIKKIIYYCLVKTNALEAKRIAAKLKNENFDLVHTNSSVVNFGGLLSRELQLPHVWHVRELQESFDLEAVISEKKLYQFMRNYSEAIIAISKYVEKNIKERVTSRGIIQIYNGVAEKMLNQKHAFPQKGDTIKFLIAGNICKQKGQEDTVLAVRELSKQGVMNFHLYIAGNGDVGKLKESIDKYSLNECVTILGEVKDMKALREQMDVEIMASELEPFGRVVVEAMKSSNPVIGAAAGGTLELIDDMETGFLYPYGDYAALAMCMKRFIDEPELVKKIGTQAYQKMKDRFTSKENADKVMAVYQGIMSFKGGGDRNL